MNNDKSILALDVGDKRVGVAIASRAARLPRPLTTLKRGPKFWSELQNLVAKNKADVLIVGLPRNLDGEETAQTSAVRGFAEQLKTHVNIPLVWQDEALSSRQAESELKTKRKQYAKDEIDALAATFILEDYLSHAVYNKNN